jgi:hypothetical protein
VHTYLIKTIYGPQDQIVRSCQKPSRKRLHSQPAFVLPYKYLFFWQSPIPTGRCDANPRLDTYKVFLSQAAGYFEFDFDSIVLKGLNMEIVPKSTKIEGALFFSQIWTQIIRVVTRSAPRRIFVAKTFLRSATKVSFWHDFPHPSPSLGLMTKNKYDSF